MAGILFAILVGTGTVQPFQAIGAAFPYLRGDDVVGEVATAAFFLALAVLVARMGMRKVE
jgi:hypothetical protein